MAPHAHTQPPTHGRDTLRIAAVPTPAFQRFGPFVGRLFQPAATTSSAAGHHLVALLAGGAPRAQERWKARHKAGALRVFGDGSALIGRTAAGVATWWPLTLDTPESVLTVPLYAGKSTSLALCPHPGHGTIVPEGASAAAFAWPKALEEALAGWLDAAGPVPDLDDPRVVEGGLYSVYSPFPSPTPDQRAFLDTLLDHLSVLVGARARLRVVPKLLSPNGQQGRSKVTLHGAADDTERTGALFRAIIGHPAWPIPATHLVSRGFHDVGPGAHPVATSAHAHLAAHRWFAAHFPNLPTTEASL